MVEIYEGDSLCVKLVCLRRASLPFRRSDLPNIIEAHQGWSSDLYLGVPLAVSWERLAQWILIFGGLVALGIEGGGG